MYKSGDQVQWSGCGFTNVPATVVAEYAGGFIVRVPIPGDELGVMYMATAEELAPALPTEGGVLVDGVCTYSA